MMIRIRNRKLDQRTQLVSEDVIRLLTTQEPYDRQ